MDSHYIYKRIDEKRLVRLPSCEQHRRVFLQCIAQSIIPFRRCESSLMGSHPTYLHAYAARTPVEFNSSTESTESQLRHIMEEHILKLDGEAMHDLPRTP